jgi:uncharacterized protein YdaU (DUF1376 family)
LEDKAMKDPAVLFYTSDFISGTLTMTDEQRGKYILLLCLQHQKGFLTEKDMLNICKTHDQDVFDKFVKDKNGNYYNQRMRFEAEKRKAYSESRKQNRSKKDKKNISESYVNHMENENVNESLIENRVKSEIISELSGQNIFYKRTFEEIKDFFREELKQAPESDPVTSEFNKLCLFMFKDGFLGDGINNLRLFSHLMTFDEYKHLIKMGVTNKFIQECLESMANDDSYTQKKNSLFLTLKNWYNRKQK